MKRGYALCAAFASVVLWLAPALRVSAESGAGLASAADGEAAFAAGRIDEAHGIWRRLAETGDPQAQLDLGNLCELGAPGLPANAADAFGWYLRAATAGLPAAQFDVAAMRGAGRGVARDPDVAALWYARAAAGGHARARFVMGQLYDSGEGVPRNPALAQAWYRAAADGGIQAAETHLSALPRSPGTAYDDLVPPTPLFPRGVVAAPLAAGEASVDLVWSAPAQSLPVAFFVEVDAGETAAPREVFSAYADTSAIRIRLQQGRYTWRVSTVGRTVPHYSLGEWSEFTVGPAG